MLILINHYIVRMEILTNPDTQLYQQKLGVQERAKTCFEHNESWKKLFVLNSWNAKYPSPAQDP